MHQNHKIDKNFICIDCEVYTCPINGIAEYYSLKDNIWFTANPPNTKGSKYDNGMLCIGCVEKRLGRELNLKDFIKCPLNELDFPWKKSQRLIDRLSRK